MKKWLMYIGFVLFLSGIIFLFGFAQYKHNSHRINQVDINFKGNETRFLTTEIVDKLLIQKTGNPLNQLNSSINLHLIEETVQSNQMVENAEVFLNPEGHLNITIEQRIPIARIITATRSYYLDDKGLEMPLSTHYTERVPLVTGVYTAEMEKEVFLIADAFRKDEFFKKQIVGWNRLENGDYLLNVRVGKHQIVFGKAEDIEDKMSRLKIFYKKMWNDEVLKTYQFLNVKYKNQVIGSY
jgi:cell division protein FtsQ